MICCCIDLLFCKICLFRKFWVFKMEIIYGYIIFQFSLEDIVWFQFLSYRCNVCWMCFVECSVWNIEDCINCLNSFSFCLFYYIYNVFKSYFLFCSKYYSLVCISVDGKFYCYFLCCSYNVFLYCFVLKNSELSSLVCRSFGGIFYFCCQDYIYNGFQSYLQLCSVLNSWCYISVCGMIQCYLEQYSCNVFLSYLLFCNMFCIWI